MIHGPYNVKFTCCYQLRLKTPVNAPFVNKKPKIP